MIPMRADQIPPYPVPLPEGLQTRSGSPLSTEFLSRDGRWGAPGVVGAGEALVLHVYGPAQSLSFTNDLFGSLALARTFYGGSLPAWMNLTLTSGPVLYGAASPVSWMELWVPSDIDVAELDIYQLELAVSNVDATESMSRSPAADITLANGSNTILDLDSDDGTVGADLTYSGGTISTTAGGVFWIQAQIRMRWTPP